MANLLAKRYICTICGGEYLIINEGVGSMKCCGQVMELKTGSEYGQFEANEYVDETSALLGRKYRCEKCGVEAVCSVPGKKIPACCGQIMNVIGPKKINAAF